MTTAPDVSNIISKLPPAITKIFGGNSKLTETAGLLAWDSSFIGIHYIDRIKPEHMPDSNVAVGQDPNGRPFVALKITEHTPESDPVTFVICIFQRYGDNPHCWVCGTTHTGRLIPCNNYLINNTSLEPIGKQERDILALYQRVVKKGYKCYTGFDT